MSLASRLAYDHAFAGGYPGVGSQPLPTDADAIDYLSRMATADGAGVETGVAVAVDAFFRDTKAAGVFDALKACCILAGARTLAGALVPLVGTAPTNNNFVTADYTRGGATPGLKGDGTTKWLDSNRNNNADPQDSQHVSVYVSQASTSGAASPLVSNSYPAYIMTGDTSVGSLAIGRYADNSANLYTRSRSSAAGTYSGGSDVGFVGINRSESTGYLFLRRASGIVVEDLVSQASQAPFNGTVGLFRSGVNGTTFTYNNGRMAFYSIGESLDLEPLDDAVSALVAAIGAAI